MATKYTKPLQTATFKTIGGGSFEVRDTVDKPVANWALSDFKGEKIVKAEQEEQTVLIPFHAVNNVLVSMAESEEQTRADAYCKEETEPTPDPEP